jgi:hypothetical protein
MPLERAQLAIFEASAKMFRRIEKRQLVLRPWGFGHWTDRKAEMGSGEGVLEFERANGR